MDERLEDAPIGVLVVANDGTVAAVNDVARDLVTGDDEPPNGDGEDDPLAERDVRTAFPHSVDRTVPSAFEGEGPDESRSFEEYYPDLDRWLSVSLVPGTDDATIYLQDVTDRKDAERTERRLRGELERLELTDSLVSELLSELVEASTRAEIADTICERLGETDLYEFAWVGERELGGDGITVRASEGGGGRTLDRVREALDGPDTIPEEAAVESGESRVVQPLADDPSVPGPVRQAAFADGLQSVLAIPLTYGTSVYGVVGVYATGQEAFSERERASFETVGEMAGFAVNAARHRTLLLSDSVVEVTFQVGVDGGPLARTAADLETRVRLDGLVPREDGSLLCYVVVDDADPEAAVATLDRLESTGDARVVDGEETGGVLQVELDASTPLGLLSGRGATIRSAAFEPSERRIVAEFSPEEDVRRIADAVTRAFDGEVVAKRRHERDATTPTEFRDELRDRLTERQETALRTAFFANYFESPRGSTAEEVADALDVTGPTLLYHLRAGQRKLLAEFFDATADDQPHTVPD